MNQKNKDRIESHYLQIWQDWEIIQVMDLNIAERHEIWQMYCEEIRPSADNTWCPSCVVNMFKELIVKYKNE
jgi:hypothetical protein